MLSRAWKTGGGIQGNTPIQLMVVRCILEVNACAVAGRSDTAGAQPDAINPIPRQIAAKILIFIDILHAYDFVWAAARDGPPPVMNQSSTNAILSECLVSRQPRPALAGLFLPPQLVLPSVCNSYVITPGTDRQIEEAGVRGSRC